MDHYFDYSLEVSSQIPEKTTRKTFYLTGIIHEKFNDEAKDYVISKVDPTYYDEYNNSLRIDVSDDKVEMSGLIYYDISFDKLGARGMEAMNWTKDYQGDAPGAIEGGITQNADENSGEDNGVDIPTAIVVGTVGVLGAGAATAAGAAAAGAAGSAAATGAAGSSVGTDGGEIGEDERRKKRYKMYIQKNFGNAIRKSQNYRVYSFHCCASFFDFITPAFCSIISTIPTTIKTAPAMICTSIILICPSDAAPAKPTVIPLIIPAAP